jgi:SAM-dependent methyltransferase
MDSLEVVTSKTRWAYDLAAQRYHDLFHKEMYEMEYDRKLLDSFASRFQKGALICDAGCGPSGHIGRYVSDKGIHVIGIDVSEQCVQLARRHNPEMRFEQGDIANLLFDDESLDGIISYYSVLHTPKHEVGGIFKEFHRVLKTNGYLLIAVKAGSAEGYINDLLGITTEIYMALFSEKEITDYFQAAGFRVEFIEKRNPYDFEIDNERIFALGKKKQK